MKKLLFVVDNLVMGGVTTVLLNLLNKMDYSKYKIDLLVLHYNDNANVELPEEVSVIKGDSTYKYVDCTLGTIVKNKNIKALIGKLWLVFLLKTGLIKNAIKRSRKNMLTETYDTEVAFNDGFTQVFTASGNTSKKVAWLHSDISVFDDSARYESLIKESLKEFDEYACVSEQVKKAYEEKYKIKNATVIHNIIDTKKIKDKAESEIEFEFDKDRINLISVGRLCEAKNYGRFIRVHKMLINEGYNVSSYVIGDGIDRDILEREISENGVEKTFKLLGRRENPFPYVKNADLFVLSSNHEGLPTVLYEALVLGIPCVSCDVAGAREIIKEGYGIITEKSDEALFDGIKQMLDGATLSEYTKTAKTYSFSANDILTQVESIL